ncbi:MAG: recombination protein O N-terminal domain-containing protein [Treponema sp.]|nr:recombination protein O N-terminal domain-containing protein [Treponema sp.]
MNRNYQSDAIVLSISSLGESNSLVTLLTKDRGIVKACLYGGPKSKLRSLCAQFHTGKVWIYETPEKNQNKISDFEVTKYHQTFSENLFKSYSALLATELIIKTECAGGGENISNCWNLINGFYDGLELCNEEQGKTGLLRFLWRFVHLSGLLPDTEGCEICGKSFSSETLSEKPEKVLLLEEMFGTPQKEKQIAPNTVYYSQYDCSFICHECAPGTQGPKFPLSMMGLNYLSSINTLPASASRNMLLDESSYFQIKQIVFDLAQKAANGTLNTLQTGMGIL